MDATMERTRRLFAAIAMVAMAFAVVAPLSASAANESCGTSTAMTDGPSVSVGGTPVGVHPAAGVARNTVAKHASNWYTGVFHDTLLISQAPMTLRVYTYNDQTRCLNLKEVCHSDASGPSSPGRCQFDTDSARYYVEARNDGDTSVDYDLVSIYHCYAKNPNASCAVMTP
jgi:hypothetical protein